MSISAEKYSRIINRCVVSLWCCLFLIRITYTQTIQFERISNELGLSQNYISCIYQDQKGFIWVGTKDGLNRFDGYQFKVFRANAFDSTSISHNTITAIEEDNQGRLWIGTIDGLNLMDRSNQTFQHIKLNGNHYEVTSIVEDDKGSLWIATSDGNVDKCDITKAEFTIQSLEIEPVIRTNQQDERRSRTNTRLIKDERNNIWVFNQQGLKRIHKTSHKQEYQVDTIQWEDLSVDPSPYKMEDFIYVGLNQTIVDKRIYSVFKTKQGQIGVSSAVGLSFWNPSENNFDFQPIDLTKDKNGKSPLDGTAYGPVLEDKQGNLWFGGYLALVIINPRSGAIIERFSNESGYLPGMPNANVKSLLMDNAGVIWAGTNGDGLYKYAPHTLRFSQGEGNQPWQGRSVRSIYQTSDGTIWIGITQSQLLQWDIASNQMNPVILNDSWERDIPENFSMIFAIHEDHKRQLWLGGEHGLFKFVHENGAVKQWKHFPIAQFHRTNTKQNGIQDIYEDKNGKLWLLTLESFGWFEETTTTFYAKSYLDITNGQGAPGSFPCIHQQANGVFWLGTSSGLLKYEDKKQTYTLFSNDINDPQSLSSNAVKCITADPEHPNKYLWIATSGGGLNKFDLRSNTFEHFRIADGLPDEVVYSVLVDESNKLWLSTNQGLSKMDRATKTFRNYKTVDGLQDNEFNSGAYFKAPDGRLFFGGIKGINGFYPHTIKDNNYLPPTIITGFKIANKEVVFSQLDGALQETISEAKLINLSYKDKVFSFEFAALDYTDPSRNQYAYRLEGFDKEWQYIDHQRTATFTNIDPGTYTFKVKGTNNDGVWNENNTALKVIIHPPWWQRWWAYTLGGILLLGSTIFFYLFNLRRQLAIQEAKRLQELDDLKSELYTNITHEFRTPLTVIMGLAKQQPHISEVRNYLDIIYRNSNNLLRMVNQLLDLAKLESKNMELDWIQADIVSYLKYLTESFQSMAAEKLLTLSFKSDCDAFVMDFDEGKIQQVIYNLLSNAIKFTSDGGRVELWVSPFTSEKAGYLQVKIVDTGIGISKTQLPAVFDRFFQADSSSTRKSEGTGIGLALTKELVELMEGEIEVTSLEGEGTSFFIYLPIHHDADRTITAKREIRETTDDHTTVSSLTASVIANEEAPLLLIIEDNRDVVTYIKYCVEKYYRILSAPNGQIGINQALEHIPDIIISDVMMPQKDGFEVVEYLKNDVRTSHIPIILLTAKATQESKLTGLKSGADAYLMKPFNKEELLIRLQKLVELRQKLQAKFSTNTFLEKPLPPQASLEDIFLQKIKKAIEDRLADPSLSVDDLSQAVFLSHTQMYRKVKALTGKTPTLLIRSIRLQKAKELLSTTQMNVSQVAFEVGFKDPNYFSRAFQKEFGMPPSSLAMK